MKEFPRYMTLGQTCSYLNIKSRNTLKKFIESGLKVSVVNGTKRIDKFDVDEYMKKHQIN
jgi:hypothetical protein